MTSILVSRHHIKKSHALYGECDFLCFVSKNLYNHCLYKIRNYGFLKDDHGFKPSEDVIRFREKNKEKDNNKEEENAFSTNTFYLGNLIYQDKSGEVKIKKRFAFETTELYHVVKNSPEFRTQNHTDYFGRSINTKTLKQTIRQVSQDFSNFFASIKAYNISKNGFSGKPQLPYYKPAGKSGRTVCTVPCEAISFKTKKNILSFGGTNITFSLSDLKDKEGNTLTRDRILEAKIVPLISGYDILISYLDHTTKEDYQKSKKDKKTEKFNNKTQNKTETETETKTKGKSKKLTEEESNVITFNELKEKHEKHNTDFCLAGCDIGLNNIVALSGVNLSTDLAGIIPLLVNGRHVKSINQYYNKKLSEKKSHLSKNTGNKQKTSESIKSLTQKRNNKILTELHRVSKCVTDWCLKNSISCLVIGKNDGWKQSITLGRKTNQNFVFVPHVKLIHMIKYKCEREGIAVLTTEESYTSKCSFLDKEKLCSHAKNITDDFGNLVKINHYKGRRTKRGLFKTSNGCLLSADINGSGNIMVKVAGNDVFKHSNLVEAFAVTPLRVSLSA